MTTLHIQGQTDEKGDLLVHLGRPNTPVAFDLTLPEDLDAMTQEEWSARFDELASQIDPSVFERLPQTPIRDPFSE